MSFCTFGIYEVYWSYRNWKIVKARNGSELMPFWRAFFYPLWHYRLLTEIDRSLEDDFRSSALTRGLSMAAVLLLNAAVSLPDPYWLLSFLTVLGFLPVLAATHRQHESGAIREPVRVFHPANLFAYLLGGPVCALIVLSSIGFLPSTTVIAGDRLWERDIEYLRGAEILGPDEEILYFYSEGFLSIAEGGQFISDEYVTSYFVDPEDGETYVNFAPYDDIDDIDVSWAESMFDTTTVTVTTKDRRQFYLVLSSEDEKDRDFVDAMHANWRGARE